MYEQFYGLRERPFSLTPDPDYLYPSRIHTEALNHLRYGIEAHASFIVITGEIGCGKTTLLQAALRDLDERTSAARLVNTLLDPRELIESIMLDFGLDVPAGRSRPQLLRDFAQFLVGERNAGHSCLLVVDEAQNLDIAGLEEIRMLSNLETERAKLIQIALVGQPALRATLNRPELEQLRQRVSVSYHLGRLDADDTAAYLAYRLRRAAATAPLEFRPDVSALIHRHSHGVPRGINIIADAILLSGYGAEQHDITIDLAHAAIADLETSGVIYAVHEQNVSPLAAPQLQLRSPIPEASDPAGPSAASSDLAWRPATSADVESGAVRRPQQRIDMRDHLRQPRPASPPLTRWARLRRSLSGGDAGPALEE